MYVCIINGEELDVTKRLYFKSGWERETADKNTRQGKIREQIISLSKNKENFEELNVFIAERLNKWVFEINDFCQSSDCSFSELINYLRFFIDNYGLEILHKYAGTSKEISLFVFFNILIKRTDLQTLNEKERLTLVYGLATKGLGFINKNNYFSKKYLEAS